ncbi:MAG: complex I subunit 5 family protein [Thiotrichales bacterium]
MPREWLDPVAWLILLPLAWASVAFVMGPRRGARLALLGLVLQVGLALRLAFDVVNLGPRTYAVGGWGAPLGIDLMADGLAALMLLMTAAVALPLGVYARAYYRTKPRGGEWFWPLLGFLLAGLNALFLAADLFNLYVSLEILGLAAVALTAASRERHAVAAGLRYLLATLLGSGAYLMGVALIYGTYGSVALETLTPLLQPLPITVLAFALMTLGMLLKTALFPLHFWLPPAHGGAASPVSALLSALVIKASFYLLLRLWFGLFAPLTTVAAAQLLGVLGAAAILWGSVLALRQSRLKMLVAYSTVAQVGYLFLVFPLATGVAPETATTALQGGVMQILAHALAKAAMFAAAGAMIVAVGRDDIAGLYGVGARLPVTLFSFALAAVTLMGLPPSGGFSAKWLLLMAALDSGQWWWVVVMIVGGLLAAAYVFKVLRQAFIPARSGAAVKGVPRALELSALALALAAILLGLFGAEPLLLLNTGVAP